MPFLNFGSNKNKYCNLSDMNFLIKNIKNRYSDPDRLWTRIRIHFIETYPNPLLRKGGSEDPDTDPLFQNVDPKIRIRIHVKMRWIRNAYYKAMAFEHPTHLIEVNYWGIAGWLAGRQEIVWWNQFYLDNQYQRDHWRYIALRFRDFEIINSINIEKFLICLDQHCNWIFNFKNLRSFPLKTFTFN